MIYGYEPIKGNRMKLDKEDVKSMEKVGTTSGGDLFHIETKGGFNMIVKKLDGGELRVIGKGAHKALALHEAEVVEKNAQWSESLFKSEAMVLRKDIQAKPEQQVDPSGNPIYESNPQNHYDMATFHSKMAGKMADAERQAKGHREKLLDLPVHSPIH